MFLSFILYAIIQIIAIRKFEGNLKKAALVPLPFGVIIFIITVIGMFMGSNLFPIFLLASGPILFPYIFILLVIYLYQTQGLLNDKNP